MSRRLEPYHVFGFATTHEALLAERVLKEGGTSVVPIPTPGALGSRCGIAMRVRPPDAESARAMLREAGIEVDSETDIEDF